MYTDSGIYKILNLINGKIYIGSTNNLKRRKSQHFFDLKFNKHGNSYLQNSYNKYSKENFIFIIIEYIKDTDFLIGRENYWINLLKANDNNYGYNIRKYAINNLGFKHSLETIQLMSNNHIGFSGKHHSEETIQKISDATSGKNNPMFGKKHTSESIQKMSDAQTGKHHSKETIEKMSGRNNFMYGKHHSKETIQKMSGKNHPIYGKTKENNPNFGKHRSLEFIEKISGKNNSMFGKHHSEKTIQKMSNAKIGKNNPCIIKKEIILQIKDMLNNKISVKNIYKTLNISINTIYKVKSGWYDNIYGI